MNVVENTRLDSGITLGNLIEKEQFSVKADAAFFDILSKSLYSNSSLAVIRETITNAVDANRENNVTDPVKVTLDYAKQTFTVEDHGKGIPHDKIHEIYCVYGSSTKLNTELTGGFGLGCKSPFALVNSFTISNCYNGIRKNYILSKENGIPTIIKIENEVKDTNSGLTVIIPLPKDTVPHLNSFDNLIRNFCAYAGINVVYNGSSIIGVKYTGYYAHYVAAYEGLDLITLSTSNSFFVRYGTNVYSINLTNNDIKSNDRFNEVKTKLFYTRLREISLIGLQGFEFRSFWKTFNLIFNLPPNSVDITPSRESLKYTPKTINTLINAFEQELKRLDKVLNTDQWLKAFKEEKLLTLCGADSIFDKISREGCFTYKDLNLFKLGTTERNTNPYIYTTLLEDKDTPEDSKEYAKYWLNNLDIIDSGDFYDDSAEAINKFETPFRKCLIKNNIDYYYYDNICYDPKVPFDTIQIDYIARIKNSIGRHLNIRNRLFKVLIITNTVHSARNKQYLGRRAFHRCDVDYLYERSYFVVTRGSVKAYKLQKELEALGWFVINFLPEPEEHKKTPVQKNKTQALIDSIKDKDTCYYSYKEESSPFFERCRYTFINEIDYFIQDKAPTKYLKYLKRYSNFRRIEVTNANSLSVFKKNEIKSVDDIILADIKELLLEDKDVNTVASLMYYGHISSYREYRGILSKIFWFTFQNETLCKRYNLPYLSKEQLAKICLIDIYLAACKTDYSQYISPYLVRKGKVAKIADRLDQLYIFNNSFNYLLQYIYACLEKANRKETPLPETVDAFLLTVLDSIFGIGEKVND